MARRTSPIHVVATGTAAPPHAHLVHVTARALPDHVKGERLYAAWHLASTTGMRRGEMLGLRWVDVNFEVGRIAVRQTYVRIDGTARFSVPKTAKSRRNIDLDGETTGILHDWQEQQDAERAEWGEAWQDSRLVAPGAALRAGRDSNPRPPDP